MISKLMCIYSGFGRCKATIATLQESIDGVAFNNHQDMMGLGNAVYMYSSQYTKDS